MEMIRPTKIEPANVKESHGFLDFGIQSICSSGMFSTSFNGQQEAKWDRQPSFFK